MKNGFEISEGTYAFYRDGDEVVEVAQCHPAFYCTRVDGVYRTPLPPLSDRELPAFDFEDEIIARLDGDVVDEDELEALGFDDLFIEEIEREPVRIAAFAAPAPAVHDVASDDIAPVVTVLRRRAVTPKAIAADSEALPAVLSPRRAVLAGPKVVLKETGPDDHSWKGNTTNGRQFARHR
ncbi:MAG TPA: hypothetical protein VL426_01475 [Candidatus Binatia bacterium]|nr:hypothetical protein [Candidatus Binatia bacterium]